MRKKMNPDTQVTYFMREGFSLVEVIIAVALLALMAIPILVYFTNASVYSSRGKNTQKANMVAQTILEDIESCDSLSQVEEKMTSASGGAVNVWTPTATYSPDASARTATLERDFTVDKFTYHAVVNLDYKGDSDAYYSVNQFNDHNIPLMSSVYGTNNVVLSDSLDGVTDLSEEAVSDFLVKNPSDKRDDIVAAMTRQMYLNVEKTSEEVTTGASVIFYNISAYYRYSYKSLTHDSYLGTQKIEKEKLENAGRIYVFYSPQKISSLTFAEEYINVDLTGLDDNEAGKVNFYFVCQDPDAMTASSYIVNFSGSGYYDKAKYHANEELTLTGRTTGVVPEGLTGVKYDQKDASGKYIIKRIAKITVNVYDKADMSKSLVTLETSKGD